MTLLGIDMPKGGLRQMLDSLEKPDEKSIHFFLEQ